MERTAAYRGRYHVLGGALSALDGRGPDELGIDRLVARAAAPGIAEVILATSATVEGHDEPLPLFEVTMPDGETKRLAQVRRIGIQAQLVDPENPGETINISIDDYTPVRAFQLAWTNYTDLFARFNFLRYFWNSLFITVVATLIMLLVNSMAAFALAKYQFRGRMTVFVVIIATLMIPPTIVLVPLFLVVNEFGLINNPWGVIWPGVATPTGVFLLRQYMLTIPRELDDAAKIDGAGPFRILWSIIIPQSWPVIVAVSLFHPGELWDPYFEAPLFLVLFLILSRRRMSLC